MAHAYSNPTVSASIPAGSWRAWSIALRPKTFWIATIPVIVSSALVIAENDTLDTGIALLALVASLLLQAMTNLQNDVGYAVRRVAISNHMGLSRATCNGWLSPRQVRAAIVITVLASLMVGLPIVMRSGWPAALMGIASIMAALGYMGGPRPIAFTPVGELTVFVFFGLTAVVGSYYVQTGAVSVAATLGAIGIGALAAAVLTVNNHRDRDHDGASGRSTFAVTFGSTASRSLFALLLIVAFAVVPALALSLRSAWLLLPLVALPTALRIWRDFSQLAPGPAWNELLFRTVKLELAYGLLLAAGAVLTRL